MSQADAPQSPTLHALEFSGKGSAYFRIWIVNLALTIITLGVFGAWAKVRTKRYFNGSTWMAGHAFDYHASPWRILIGRTIAFGLLLGYNVSVSFKPILAAPWILIGLYLFPWLVNSSIRFNARNTSYRNVRFNFGATDIEALVAYVVWPIAGFCTLGLLMPAAQRARDYFFTNNHSYGGRYFETEFSAWRIYGIYGLAVLMFIGLAVAFVMVLGSLASAMGFGQAKATPSLALQASLFGSMAVFYLAFLFIGPIIHTMVVNLTINHAGFDERHRLKSTMSPFAVAWIVVSNAFLTLITLGLFYPWAKVRLMRYRTEHLALLPEGDLDSYISERFETQSAVGEEIGSAFSFDFGL